MSWIWIRCLIALLPLVWIAGPARAEEAASRAIAKGRWSIAISLPDGGGGSMGLWRMVSDRSNLGATIGVAHTRETITDGPDTARVGMATQFWSVSLEPSIKRYLALREAVSPYLFGGLKGSYGWSNGGGFYFSNSNRFTRSATLRVGLGADWTPLEAISIGAATGILWTESMTSYSEPGAPKRSESQFDTMTTSLTMHLYF
ncbi:MAG: hypothetical protein E6K77_09775 [Candidatus Eisenbacteria bacterium]|uniref:Outer membrane protein beta-barrel domain-containing protein n=1 Tax=Eiseniibacteriota bacterium TaxID=2212470 RepID=A0A538TDF2_UNCEI|nr:MAG: hypothetical protein E6K77_09775 [Candidatus Eisenbacteria bacterium]